MSGDVQPRKRKDKRRKKEDEDTGTPPPTLVSPTDTSAENVTIHVYKESSTGGHWCARIVFFVLLAVLVGLIGIIIFEHRGTTDVDTPIASSRWANIFEGWVDDTTASHGDEPHDQEETVEESEEALEEEEEKRDHDEEESVEAEKEEEEEEESVEEDEGIGEEEEEEEETEEEERREVDEGEEEVEQEEEEGTEEDNEVESKEDQEEDEGIDEGEIDEEANDSQQEFDIPGILEEIDDTNENEDTDEENDTPDNFDMELDASTDINDDSPEEKDASEEFTGIPGVNDIDDNSAEPLEEIEGEESEEDVNDGDSESEEEEIEEESTSVPVKFGVGVALVVAAHFVLVRRWNNADIDPSHLLHDITDVADLARRNTIVPPPHVKQVIKSADNIENKGRAQVEAYEDLKSKYNKLQEENVSLPDLENLIPRNEAGQIKEKDKRSTRNTAKEGGRSKVISSEEEDEEEDYEGDELETSEGERASGAEEYEEEQAEEEEEEEEEDEEDEENVDDSELIAKLEAKYGKLPTPQDSEAEEEEAEEESEEEEEEGEDDELPEWKRVKAPKDSRVESQSRRPMQQTGMKTKHADTNQAKSGGRTYDFSNVSNIDDIIIYEENDSAVPQIGKEFLD